MVERRRVRPVTEDVTETDDVIVKQTEQRFRNAWETFFRSPRTREDSSKRTQSISDILGSLPEHISEHFTLEAGGKSRLSDIREEAEKYVQNERSKSIVGQPIHSRPSRGVARATRRKKASERRGTPPDRIH